VKKLAEEYARERSRSRPTAWCLSVACCTWSHSGASGQREGLVGGGGAEVSHVSEASLAPDVELRGGARPCRPIALAPRLEPPAGVLGGQALIIRTWPGGRRHLLRLGDGVDHPIVDTEADATDST